MWTKSYNVIVNYMNRELVEKNSGAINVRSSNMSFETKKIMFFAIRTSTLLNA